VDSALRKYLASGHPLAYAAACAGIPYAEAKQQLESATDDSDLDVQRLALAEHTRAALDTLQSLLSADDERVRLSAAKTLLELQVKHKPRKLQIASAETIEDLWSARRSVDRDRVDQVQAFDLFEETDRLAFVDSSNQPIQREYESREPTNALQSDEPGNLFP
jgi:hypothetical protein